MKQKHFTSERITAMIKEAYEASENLLQLFVEELIDDEELLQNMNDLRDRINVLFTARDDNTVSKNEKVLDELDNLVQGEPEAYSVNLTELQEHFNDVSAEELIYNVIIYFAENEIAMYEYTISQ